MRLRKLTNEVLQKLLSEQIHGHEHTQKSLAEATYRFCRKYGVRNPDVTVIVRYSDHELNYSVSFGGHVGYFFWKRAVSATLNRQYSGVHISRYLRAKECQEKQMVNPDWM